MTKYYDIDDIITEEEIVSVIFQKEASGVGIDPSSENDYIETGSKVELPFWLAQELQLRQVVSISIPSCFDQKTRLEIQADCASVDLRSRCPFFYEFGCKIAPGVGDRTIGFLLLSAFKNRYKELLTKAHTAAFSAATKFWSILTNEEINLYEAALWHPLRSGELGDLDFRRPLFLEERENQPNSYLDPEAVICHYFSGTFSSSSDPTSVAHDR